MNSNKNIIIGGIVLVAVVLLVWLVIRDNKSVDNSATPTPIVSLTPFPSSTFIPPQPSVSTVVSKPVLRTVHLTASGLMPKTLTIHAGDAVMFTNDTTSPFWPASDPHPTHTLCPGFDASRSLGRGEAYTFVFSIQRVCTYHNHQNPGDTNAQGTIIVQ